MQVQNISKRSYIHSKFDDKGKLFVLTLRPNEVKDIPDEVAESWIKTGEVVEYVNPEVARKKEEQLKKENAELRKKLEEAKVKDCDECYSDDKTPAQDDCDKCKKKETKSKKTAKKTNKK